jgi:hypothetical protein
MKNNNDNLLMSAIKDLGKLEAENRKLKSSLTRLEKSSQRSEEIFAKARYLEARLNIVESAFLASVKRTNALVDILIQQNPKLKERLSACQAKIGLD